MAWTPGLVRFVTGELVVETVVFATVLWLHRYVEGQRSGVYASDGK
jgi:hypothetical protein